MRKKDKPGKSEKVKYDDLFFYKIPLENDQLLFSKKVLNKHFPNYKRVDKQMDRLSADFVSYRDGIFTCVLTKDEIRYEQVYFGVEKDAIHVACDCSMPGGVLCEHAYRAIQWLTWGHTGKLDKYYWPGFEPDAEGKSKYLDIDNWKSDMKIRPKVDYGHLYRRGLGFRHQDAVQFERKLPEPAFKKEGIREVIGYQLLYTSPNFWHNHLPLLMPFIGTTNKRGDDISFYKTYLKRDNPHQHTVKLSNDQVMLNEICFAMYDIAMAIPYSKEIGVYSTEMKEYMPVMLDLWQKVIPMLKHEQFVKSTYSYHLKILPDRPQKKDLKPAQITISNIDLSFLLSDKGEYYQLKPVIKVNGKDISEDCYKVYLFLLENDNYGNGHFHLISNLQDEYLLNWFSEGFRKLTVLKADFDAFYDDFLKSLSECYQVMFKRRQGNLLLPFSAAIRGKH